MNSSGVHHFDIWTTWPVLVFFPSYIKECVSCPFVSDLFLPSFFKNAMKNLDVRKRSRGFFQHRHPSDASRPVQSSDGKSRKKNSGEKLLMHATLMRTRKLIDSLALSIFFCYPQTRKNGSCYETEDGDGRQFIKNV